MSVVKPPKPKRNRYMRKASEIQAEIERERYKREARDRRKSKSHKGDT
jgi:hypothetical protein